MQVSLLADEFAKITSGNGDVTLVLKSSLSKVEVVRSTSWSDTDYKVCFDCVEVRLTDVTLPADWTNDAVGAAKALADIQTWIPK